VPCAYKVRTPGSLPSACLPTNGGQVQVRGVYCWIYRASFPGSSEYEWLWYGITFLEKKLAKKLQGFWALFLKVQQKGTFRKSTSKRYF
jgi:hypothetical protein